MSDADVDLLIRGRRPRRRWLLPAAAAAALLGGAGAFLLLQPEESDVAVEVQEAEATTGQLTTTLSLSGSAAAERSAALGFEGAGVVVSVSVEVGDAVRAGQELAALEDSAARRRVETASVQLEQARLRLAELLADPQASELAAAVQSLRSAESQVGSAERALDELLAPPQASELASAEQAVASAAGQLSSAEEALSRLTAPPTGAELASAEQAVASALGQLSSAEETLSQLTAPPTEAELASARSSITQARAQLTSAINGADSAGDALDDAFTEYCDAYAHLPDVAETTCARTLPLTDEQVQALRDSTEGRSANYGRRAEAVIAANVASVTADAGRESADTALAQAEERLRDLLAPAQADAIYRAERALEAARLSHAAATARLDDLTAPPDEQEIFQAERALEAARSSHASATARLHDLTAEADADDLAQARAQLESARSALLTARARHDELQAGPTASAIAQQELSVRLAEISLEGARADLDALTLRAPFDGVVGSVDVRPGDRVGSTAAALTLATPAPLLIELTVTESDLLELAVGQAGLVSFDAIAGAEYPVRIVSVGTVPNAQQGVVTYDVAARLLQGAELAEVAPQIATLSGAAGVGLDALGGALGGGASGGGAAGGLLAGLELPEGVTLEQLAASLAAGEPLPEGVTLPEGLQIPPQLLERLASGIAGTPRGRGAAEDAARGAGAGPGAGRPLPVPGMSASVTVLTELREPAVLLPVSAVRQIEGAWFVAVPRAGAAAGAEDAASFERVEVTLGASDGTQVEIAGGLDAGAVVLLGADSEGIPFSATGLAPQTPAGLGGLVPGGGFGGGRGAGGGGP